MKRYTDRDLLIIENRQFGAKHVIPPARKPMDHEESRFQQKAIMWWTTERKRYGLPEIALMAHPNQGLRTARNGARMKAEGMRKGCLDMQLTVARGTYHGLWIENKTGVGKLTKEQCEHCNHLTAQGYKVVVCRSLDAIVKEISLYLSA